MARAMLFCGHDALCVNDNDNGFIESFLLILHLLDGPVHEVSLLECDRDVGGSEDQFQ